MVLRGCGLMGHVTLWSYSHWQSLAIATQFVVNNRFSPFNWQSSSVTDAKRHRRDCVKEIILLLPPMRENNCKKLKNTCWWKKCWSFNRWKHFQTLNEILDHGTNFTIFVFLISSLIFVYHITLTIVVTNQLIVDIMPKKKIIQRKQLVHMKS